MGSSHLVETSRFYHAAKLKEGMIVAQKLVPL